MYVYFLISYPYYFTSMSLHIKYVIYIKWHFSRLNVLTQFSKIWDHQLYFCKDQFSNMIMKVQTPRLIIGELLLAWCNGISPRFPNQYRFILYMTSCLHNKYNDASLQLCACVWGEGEGETVRNEVHAAQVRKTNYLKIINLPRGNPDKTLCRWWV